MLSKISKVTFGIIIILFMPIIIKGGVVSITAQRPKATIYFRQELNHHSQMV
jgi:hypothetical protein